MNLVILNEKEFTKYAVMHEQNNFHQTIEWALVKSKNGWSHDLLGLKEDNKIVAACMILIKKTPIGKILYCPRGFLINYQDKKLLKSFTKEIKTYAKRKKAIYIKIDPYVKNIERNVFGNPIKEGSNNNKSIDNLKELGYKHNGLNLYFENLQPRWLFCIDLENKNIEQILANMEPETRRIIKKNIKLNLITREIKENDLEKFKKIMQHTSDRKMFIDRPFSYYKNLYDTLSKKDMIKFVVTELDCELSISAIEKEIQEEENNVKEKKQKIENKEKININKMLEQIKICERNIKQLIDRKNEIKELMHKHGKIVTLGGILYIIYGSEVLALFGGSYKEFMSYHSFYTTNYEMIKYAIDNNYKTYNFYGITGDFNESNKHYGLYSFKKGFGGQVVELIGEFDLIISKTKMVMYNFAIKIYHLLKKIRLKR